jgi:hypothetical protein
MATRRATRKYKDLASFFEDREQHLATGFCVLPAGSVRGELAADLKLDLSIPVVGRIGPLSAQVVQRSPDGSHALKLTDFEGEAGRGLAKLDKALEAALEYFQSKGDLGTPEAAPNDADLQELETLRERVSELERELTAAHAGGMPVTEADGDVPAEGQGSLLRDGAPPESGDPSRGEAEPEAGTQALPEAQEADADSVVDPPGREGKGSTQPGVAAEGEPEAPKARGVPIVDVSNFPAAMEGVTEGSGLLNGILDIASGGKTGLLTVHQDDGVVRYGYFSSGGPVAWAATPLQEREVLGMLLFKAGQITEEQLRESTDLMQSKGIRQGEAFIEMGVMSFSQLIMVLGKQCEFIFQQLIKNGNGAWTFHELPKLPEAFLPPPVRVATLLFRSKITEGKSLRGQQLADILKEYINSYVQLSPERKNLIGDLGLNSGERKLIELIADRTLRMRELFSMSPVSRQNTASIFFALIQLGLFTFGDRETHGRYLQRVGISVGKKKRQLIQCTHFDVLEVHWVSLPTEIDDAYRRLKEEYDLSTYDNLPEDLAEVITRISNRIDEAYEVLRDDLQRREYRKDLVEDFMILQSAELLSKKGEMSIMRKDRRMAVLCFSKALELQPRSAAYRTGLQRARSA